MAKRGPSTELFYDPAELDADAPRLRIGKEAGRWELRDEQGALLSAHRLLPDAIDAALERSAARFTEILVRTASGQFEWSVHHNPDWTQLARLVNATAPSQREAAD